MTNAIWLPGRIADRTKTKSGTRLVPLFPSARAALECRWAPVSPDGPPRERLSRWGLSQRATRAAWSCLSDHSVTILNVMRRSLLFVALASIWMLVTGAASARPLSPTWSAQWIQANPGQPLVLILNPRTAAVCFVGLRGPQGVRSVGWRFQPGGHRLGLTLLTHVDATAGSWVLSALCQRRGAPRHTATVTISVPAPGGSNVLAAHGDMRVQLLPARPS